MTRRLIPWLLALLVLLPAFASREEGGSGVVYGPGHAYLLKAAKGWIFDNESGRSQGIHAVSYPVGQSWKNGSVVVYSGTTPKTKSGFDGVLEDDLKAFKEQNPDLKMKEEEPLLTGDGRRALVRKFSGDRFGNIELVAYIDTPEVVCEIVMSARDPGSFESGKIGFRAFLSSFRLLSSDPDSYFQSDEWETEKRKLQKDNS